MINSENSWDKHLKIKTTGRDASNADQYSYPYEPTPYCVLERLANSGLIGKRDVVLDYGCGKGRVDFFLSYQTRANTIGIEYDERIYQSALEIFLFFYYPSGEYISYLMSVKELEFYDEIGCVDLFSRYDLRERVVIFRFHREK